MNEEDFRRIIKEEIALFQEGVIKGNAYSKKIKSYCLYAATLVLAALIAQTVMLVILLGS